MVWMRLHDKHHATAAEYAIIRVIAGDAIAQHLLSAESFGGKIRDCGGCVNMT
jgi:hypothetical protein